MTVKYFTPECDYCSRFVDSPRGPRYDECATSSFRPSTQPGFAPYHRTRHHLRHHLTRSQRSPRRRPRCCQWHRKFERRTDCNNKLTMNNEQSTMKKGRAMPGVPCSLFIIHCSLPASYETHASLHNPPHSGDCPVRCTGHSGAVFVRADAVRTVTKHVYSVHYRHDALSRRVAGGGGKRHHEARRRCGLFGRPDQTRDVTFDGKRIGRHGGI
jgi:hypothetical protein